MKTEIIAVGSELLTPFFLDTNSLFLTERLNDLGIQVAFKTVVGDDPADLLEAIRTALRRSELIIAIGGLGPTEDDRTCEAFAEALGRKRVLHPEVLKSIRSRFERRGVVMPALNRKQAFIVEGAEILGNPNGTAPGLWIDLPGSKIALLPGPPPELKPMFDSSVRPRLEKDSGESLLLRRVMRLTGLGESLMENKIRDVYPKLPPGLSITTLAFPGQLEIHLVLRSGAGERRQAERTMARFEKLLTRRLNGYVFSRGGEDLEEVVAGLLRKKNKTLACAESCTGGLLSHRLTNVPGSSDYFLEGIVAYGNRAKNRRLGVPARLIAARGAVSAAVGRAMALGVREKTGSDFGLSITGIAGPAGGTPSKPVGLVYTALAWEGGVKIEENLFWGGRAQVKYQSSQKALDMLRRRLLHEENARPKKEAK
ncbi:MAG TPA: competence/damage-inducible protein A [Candidatus Aminicenantes bacterium]|nr:competence/damage-inducible protein A [Candidatus Aminicenantes bacterium]